MLDQLRKGAGSWFAKLLLGLLVISFAVWGVGDIFRMQSATHLAEVGGREISPAQFQRDYQNQIALVSNQLGRRLTSQEARAFGLGQRVLDNLINSTAIDIHADKLDLGISQDTIISAIHDEPSFQGANGKFDPQRFQEVLRNIGLSEAGFLALEREELVRSQIVGALSSAAFVPKTYLEAAHHYRDDERVLKYFVLSPKAVGEVAAPDEATLKAYYDENKSSYMAPEYRRIGLLLLTPDTIKDTISVTDEEIKASYEATKERYSTPERRTIQQLIFKDATAAREAADKLAKGADFVALGKELGMKESDINLGTFAKDQLADKKLAEAAFALQKDQVSQPVESFSVMLLKVTDIQPGSQKSFEEVKDQVRDALAKSRASDEISKLYDAVEDERGGGGNVADAAKKLNLPYAEYTFDSRGQDKDGKPVAPVVANPQIVKTTFSGDVGVELNAVNLGEGNAFLDVLEIIPERQKTLEEVHDKAKAEWIEAETRKRVRAKADELVQKGKDGTPIEKLAEEAGSGVTVATTPALKRDANAEGLPRTAISLGFTLPQNGYGSVQMADRLSQAIIQVTEIKPAAPLDDKQADALREELRRGAGIDILTQYVGGLQKRYGVQVNNSAMTAVLGEAE
jgi:peptidyl-prolyl cis-trans isomerase D